MSHSIALLRLLQLTDSGFPTGGYSFSHGLESLHRLGYVTSGGDVRDVVRVQLRESLARCELPLLAQAYESADRRDLQKLFELDGLASALKPIPVFHDSSVRIGKRLLDAAISAFGDLAVASEFRKLVLDGRATGHHAVVFGVVSCDLGIDRRSAMSAYALSAVRGYVAAAVRLAIIGQSGAQQIVASMIDEIDVAIASAVDLPLGDLGGYAPTIDLAGLLHRDLSGRIFAS